MTSDRAEGPYSPGLAGGKLEVMLDATLDVFRMRQYFNVLTVAREVAQGVRADAGFLRDVAGALLPVPLRPPVPARSHPFPPSRPFGLERLHGRRLALAATGGSGALASVVGVARALEEGSVRPSVISLCSGSALFGFAVAAGVPAAEVAEFALSLSPEDYVDLDWPRLLSILPTAGRGFAGFIRGEALEATYERLLGTITLGDLAIPAYAPVW